MYDGAGRWSVLYLRKAATHFVPAWGTWRKTINDAVAGTAWFPLRGRSPRRMDGISPETAVLC
ncbi:MAG: hypothetical protein D6761_07395 [Candidatus Dadabacteria bacterium]|nr:MAG: hypothetical protein D6761_07395 [Candidatus Dadabacteria bacterium]